MIPSKQFNPHLPSPYQPTHMVYDMPPVLTEPTQLDRIEQEMSEIKAMLSHLIQALAQDDDEPNDGTRDQTQPL